MVQESLIYNLQINYKLSTSSSQIESINNIACVFYSKRNAYNKKLKHNQFSSTKCLELSAFPLLCQKTSQHPSHTIISHLFTPSSSNVDPWSPNGLPEGSSDQGALLGDNVCHIMRFAMSNNTPGLQVYSVAGKCKTSDHHAQLCACPSP